MSLQRSKNILWPLRNRCSSSLVDLSDLVDNGRVEVMFRNALALVRFNLPANVASMRVTSATAPLAGAADMAFSDEPGAEGCLVFADDVPVSAENSTVNVGTNLVKRCEVFWCFCFRLISSGVCFQVNLLYLRRFA